MAIDLIDTASAKQMIGANAIASAAIIGQAGGWTVTLKFGGTEKALAAQRSKRVRRWRSLDRCVHYLKNELGLTRFDRLDASRYEFEAGTVKKRGDAAQRLRGAHQAAEYDGWFREQVQSALDGIATGANRRIEEDEWNKISEKKRADLQARILSERS